MCRVDFDKMVENCRPDVDDSDYPNTHPLLDSVEDVEKYCNNMSIMPVCGVVKVEIKELEDVIPQSVDYPRREMGYKDAIEEFITNHKIKEQFCGDK